MSRTSLLLSAAALVAACLLLPAAVAAGDGSERETVVKVELDLKASGGLHAKLENSEDGMVTLSLWRAGQTVEYKVPGKATEAGLKVRFGRLGLIDVAFTPTRTLNSTAPGDGCTGAPRTLREGVFAGTIDFTGERGYVRIEASQATGSMGVISEWKCPEAEREAAEDPFARAARRPTAKRPGKRPERESATLSAFGRGCSCVFAAGVHHRHSGGKSIFIGYEHDQLDGMEILRVTKVLGPASAFDFDHAAGTAALHPPSPLSGSATFEARRRQRPLWRSTIRVPLLGAAPIDTGDPGFAVELHSEYQFD